MNNYIIEDILYVLNLMHSELNTWFVAHYNPFYWYCFLGFVIIVGATWLGWFFDVLRPVMGAVYVGVISFLVGLYKGEKAEQDREAARNKRRR